MKTLTAIMVTVLALTLCAAPVWSAKNQKVYPTGNADTDAEAVQMAVDRASGSNGVVILKARNRQGVPTAFNFGEDGQVVVEGPGCDIKILGEGGDDDADDDNSTARRQ